MLLELKDNQKVSSIALLEKDTEELTTEDIKEESNESTN